MSTNPNNAVGTNGAYGGRTSANAFNDVMGALSRGVVSGWACTPNSGMTVSLGGSGTTRDVAIAEDNAGNKTSINNISGSPVNVTIAAAPGANSRIDVVVAYVDNPPAGTSTVADNPGACGIIAVSGTAASTPVAPNDSAIRTAITADGASGTTAYYVVLAQVTVENGTTDITAGDIAAGDVAKLTGNGVVTSNNIDFTTLAFGNYSETEQNTGFTWIDGSAIYKKTVDFGALPNASSKSVNHGISFNRVVKVESVCQYSNGIVIPVPGTNNSYAEAQIALNLTTTQITIDTGTQNRSDATAYVTVYYTKNA